MTWWISRYTPSSLHPPEMWCLIPSAPPFAPLPFPPSASDKQPLLPTTPTAPSTTLPYPFSLLPSTSALRPYLRLARLDNPAGSLLFLLPQAWALPLAALELHTPPALALGWLSYFALGSVLCHALGCTWNDMVDRDLDRLVERTKSRPLPSGAISMLRASLLLSFELLLFLLYLLTCPRPSQLLALSSLPLLALYPFCKRLTHLPQLFLGIAFNWGIPFAYSALAGHVRWEVVGPMWGAGVCWTVVYDKIYAHQDKADDARAGIGSTALLFGSWTGPILGGFALGMLGCLTAAGYVARVGLEYYLIAVGGSGVVFGWVLSGIEWDDMESCWKGFKRNVWVGLLVAAGVWAEYVCSLWGL